MAAWYNEIDPKAAAWTRELIRRNLIAPGEVDERDIQDITPADLRGFTQCHFFAGIGVWSYALRRAGWPDDRPVWTGSCPCQPFSASGKGEGFDDERHLWPSWQWLIEQQGPPVVFGEQVESKAAKLWIDLVQDDLEAMGYAVGAVPFPSAGVGAPHPRHRLFWVADTDHAKWRSDRAGGDDCGRAYAGRPQGSSDVEGCCQPGGMADPYGGDGSAERQQRSGEQRQQPQDGGPGHHSVPGPVNGVWADADWILCRDPDGPRWRPVEPGTFPLAHGAPARLGRLRGYGNAINAEAATQFIGAYLEA